MQLFENVPLSDYSTMRLGGPARYLTIVDTVQQLGDAVQWAAVQKLPLLVLGGGSNVIFRDAGFPGLVIINRIAGFEVWREDDDSAILRIGAGENWDSVVARTVDMGLSGIESLSLIPGSAGATPVQNVGAYGSEIADTFVELQAYDITTHQIVTMTRDDCQFGYRTSIFKSIDNRQHIITNITLKLSKQPPQPPFYESLQTYFTEHKVTEFTPLAVREAVIAVRTSKLPDPSVIPNTGSFFKNPIIDRAHLEKLQTTYPDIKYYETKDGRIKIPAGWLVDKAGLRGYASHGMKTYEKHALVLVNESASSYADLLAFQQEIQAKVQQLFGITLEQEPELL